MAVRIRLRRQGNRNNPSFRIVVADSKSPRDGRFIETIGHYIPVRQPAVVQIDAERAEHWLSHGALPSETVASLFRTAGIGKAKPASEAGEPSAAEETPAP